METLFNYLQTFAGSVFLIAGLLLAFYHVARPLIEKDTDE